MFLWKNIWKSVLICITIINNSKELINDFQVYDIQMEDHYGQRKTADY